MHYASPDSLLAPSPPLPALALFLGVALLLIAAVRWWRRDLAWSDGLLYLALTTAFFARPLLTGAIQVPVDLAYEARPFSETVAAPVAVHNRRVEEQNAKFFARDRDERLTEELLRTGEEFALDPATAWTAGPI